MKMRSELSKLNLKSMLSTKDLVKQIIKSKYVLKLQKEKKTELEERDHSRYRKKEPAMG